MDHTVITRDEWLEARRELLAKENEELRLRAEVNEARLALPWVEVGKDYRFATVDGERTLAELFDGRSQLLVYHFMFGPDWTEGCPRCSFMVDHVGHNLVHLNHHDVTWTAVSRAPLDRLQAYRERMGWTFPWASSYGSDFNYDFGVSFTDEQRASGRIPYNYTMVPMDRDELSGFSAFARDDDGRVFHTYSTYATGLESLAGTLLLLDRAPKGRNETSSLSFVKRRDEY
ncbi:MAG: DUF899 domain-containing protein [Acidimicrobiales bacterium]